MLPIIVLAVLAAHLHLTSAQQAVQVSTEARGRFTWVSGVANVSWTAAPRQPVAYFQVDVAPLTEYKELFEGDAASPQTAPLNSTFRDFVIETGKPSNSVRVAAGSLQLQFDDAAWVNTTGNLATAPAAVRRIPEPIATAGSLPYIQVDVDCSSAPNISLIPSSKPAVAACGIVIINAATRLPLLFWGLKRTNAAGAAWSVVMDGSRDGLYSFSQAAASVPWSASGVSLYLQRTTTATAPFFLAAKLASDSTPWSSVLSKVSVPSSALDAYVPGALWFGMTGKSTSVFPAVATAAAYQARSNVSGVARFRNFIVGMTPPTAMPKDIYGLTDACVAAGLTRPVPVTAATANASQTWLVVEGLSSNFPYTVAVTPMSANGVPLAPPLPPIEGLYFWARRLPPRQQKLRLFLEAKWLSGAQTSVADASGLGHAMTNAASLASQRPVAQRSGTTWGADFAQSAYFRFSRASVRCEPARLIASRLHASSYKLRCSSLLMSASDLPAISLPALASLVAPSCAAEHVFCRGCRQLPLRRRLADDGVLVRTVRCRNTPNLLLVALDGDGAAVAQALLAFHRRAAIAASVCASILLVCSNRLTSTQVLMGRGMLATSLSTRDAGWAFALSSLSTDTATSFASMRVGAHVSPLQYPVATAASTVNVAAAQTRTAPSDTSLVVGYVVISSDLRWPHVPIS